MEFLCRMNIEIICSFLSQSEIFQLILVCKNIARKVCDYGSENWTFKFSYLTKISASKKVNFCIYKWYRPSKFSCGEISIFFLFLFFVYLFIYFKTIFFDILS